MSDEIKIGDVVRLRSGGPPMTVIRCVDYPAEVESVQHEQRITVEWFTMRGEHHANILDRRALVLDGAEQSQAVREHQAPGVDQRVERIRPWLEWAAEQLDASVRRLDAESTRAGAQIEGMMERLCALEQRAPAAPEAGHSGADLFSIRSRLTANEERFRALAEERISPLEGGVSEIRTEVDALSRASESRDDQGSKHQAEIERAHVRLDSLREDHHSLRIWQSDRDKEIKRAHERIGTVSAWLGCVDQRLVRAENILGLTAGLLVLLSQEIRTRPATDRETGARIKEHEQALQSAIKEGSR